MFTSSDDVKRNLASYGITNPDQSILDMFSGMDVIGGSAGAAIAEYANYYKAEQARLASDPLAAYQELEQKYASDSIAQAHNLFSQLQDLQSQAPKLFGELSLDQIQQYLAPLQTAFKQSVGQVQSVLASRGLGASSTEANALAQTNQGFQENVLQTGLNIGLTSQQNKANSLQAQIQNLFGFGASANAQAGAAAGQRSAQNLSQSNLIASLPYFLRSSGAQEAQAKIAQDKANQGGFLQKLGYASDIFNTAKGFASSVLSTPKDLTQAAGIAPGGSARPGGGAMMPGGSSSSLNLPQYQQLFESAGSAFGS